MTLLGVTTVDLARAQFGLTSLYHFLFVPLTLGLAPLVAVMQTIWHRTGDEAWLRLTRFFGTLLLINFAIGVATGLVQEFQFGMNWSVYSEFVGGVFGAPLAIEGLAAFFLEATFLGLWIFGWDRLSPRVHLATIWIVALGTWLSAYFILVANSWMQHPGRLRDRRRQGPAHRRRGTLLSNPFALYAYLHTMLVGLTTGSLVVLGVALLAPAARAQRRAVPPGRGAGADRRGAGDARSTWSVGSRFGMAARALQPMKIAAAEALWDTEQPARLLAVPDRRVHAGGSGPELSTSRSRACSRSWRPARSRRGRGAQPDPGPGGAAVRAGRLHPAPSR